MMNDTIYTTDRINEILTQYNYEEADVLLCDVDSWSLPDLQELLQLIDNMIVDRCNQELGEV